MTDRFLFIRIGAANETAADELKKKIRDSVRRTFEKSTECTHYAILGDSDSLVRRRMDDIMTSIHREQS